MQETVNLYVDGTFRPGKTQGYAFVAFDSTKKAILHFERKTLHNESYKISTNCSCELMAVIKAVQWAEKAGYQNINLYTDYSGVRTLSEHKIPGHRHELFDYFKIFIAKRMDYTKPKQPRVFLHKVRSHSGIFGNEIADHLARSILIKRQPTTWISLLTKWASIATHSIPALKLTDSILDKKWARV